MHKSRSITLSGLIVMALCLPLGGAGCARTPLAGPFSPDRVTGCAPISHAQRNQPSLWIRFYTPRDRSIQYRVEARTFDGAADYEFVAEGTTGGTQCVYVPVDPPPTTSEGRIEFMVTVDEICHAAIATKVEIEDEVKELGIRVYRRPFTERHRYKNTEGKVQSCKKARSKRGKGAQPDDQLKDTVVTPPSPTPESPAP